MKITIIKEYAYVTMDMGSLEKLVYRGKEYETLAEGPVEGGTGYICRKR